MAFGDTGILDNFNRSDEGPPPSSSWTTAIDSATDGLEVIGNEVWAENNAPCGGYWNVETFGPACEAFITIQDVPGNNDYSGVYTRLVTPGSSAVDGYWARWYHTVGDDQLTLFRIDNGVPTQLGSNDLLEVAVGDKLGLESDADDVHTVYYDDGGAGWTAGTNATATDTTYQSAGYIGLVMKDDDHQNDDFGGGTISAGGVDITVPVGSLEITGYAPTVATPTNVTVPVGALELTGYAPTVATPTDIEIPVGSLELTGYAPTVEAIANIDITVPVGTLEITGYAPTIATPTDVEVPVGSLEITGYAPTVAVTENVGVEIPVGTLEITGYAPTVATPTDVEIPVGSLEITGYAPDVEALAGLTITVPLGVLEITGYAPTVTVTEHVDIEVPVAALTLTGYAPTVVAGAGIDIEVPAGVLEITGYAPIVGVGVTVNVPLGLLEIAGYAPTVTLTEHVNIEIPTGSLVLTGLAPEVVGIGAVEPVRKGVPQDRSKRRDESEIPAQWREPKPSLATQQAQRAKRSKEERIELKAEAKQRELSDKAYRTEVADMMLKQDQERSRQREVQAKRMINLNKAQAAKAVKQKARDAVNKARSKNLKKARAAKKRKAKKK